MAMMCWGMKTYPVYSAIPTTETSMESELLLRKLTFLSLLKTKSHDFFQLIYVEVPVHLVFFIYNQVFIKNC
jgi:hypothetical protein